LAAESVLGRVALVFTVLLPDASLSTRDPGGAGATTFARINEKRVEVLDLKEENWRPIYQTPKAWITDLSVAPSGDRLAMLSWTRGTVTGGDYSKQPQAELVVIDTSGRTLAAVPDVHKYDWCGSDPIGLAYIQGEYSEDSDWGFRPDGRWGLLEVGTGKTRPVQGLRYPTAVACNPLDSAVYLREAYEFPAIYRFELATGTLTRAPVHDIQFSPDGRYYLSWRPELEFGMDSVKVYQTLSSSPVDISSFLRTAQPIGWVGPTGDVLLAVRRVPSPPRRPGEQPRPRPIKTSDIRPQRYLLYRLKDGRVLAEEQGFLHQWAGPADRRLIRQGEKYKVLQAH
jgi:hypothetical protein